MLALATPLIKLLPSLFAGGRSVQMVLDLLENAIFYVEQVGSAMGWTGPEKKAKLKKLLNEWIDLPVLNEEQEAVLFDFLIEMVVHFMFNRHRVRPVEVPVPGQE